MTSQSMFEMSEGQEAHLQSIKQTFNDLVEPKFRKGAEEHATILHEQPASLLLDFAIEEAIDQVVYLLTLKQRLNASEVSTDND
mgnify:CR=1 FL=1